MVKKQLKRLPIGITTFSQIIDKDYLYVDKTAFLYQLVSGNKYYFLSRPRRFGKSLLISTLEELLAGNKKLFKDLWIADSDYVWKKHPVIKIDFSGIDYSQSGRLEKSLLKTLQATAWQYGVKPIKTDSAKDLLSFLIDKLALKQSVVLLVDEYDKPIIDNVHNLEKAEEQRIILQNFYSTIKAHDAHLRFVMLTGVSKFSKTSIFSGMNNLVDISMDTRYATLLGYTPQELTQCFAPYLDRLAHKYSKTKQEIVADITNYYNGYQFTERPGHVFNPYSVLLCFDANKFDSYWFETGTPSFLIHLLQKNDYDLESITHPVLNKLSFGSFEPSNIPLVPLLFQTGYLTIKSYDSRTNNYTLGIPNKEVNDGLTVQLADAFTQLSSNKSIQYARLMTKAFATGDMEDLRQKLQEFFNRMPYTVHIQNEHGLQFVLYAIFALIGVAVDPEVVTSIGRADLVVSLPKRVYIIELKFNQSAAKALQQIQDKRYYEKYLNTGRQIMLVGIGFAQASKKVTLKWRAVAQK